MRVSRIVGLAVVAAAILARPAVTPHSVIIEFNGESARSLSARYKAAVVEVQDPVYKTRKRYRGIWLKDIIAGARLQSPGASYLLFRSGDGYWPMMPVSRALEGKGLIALQDADAPRGRKWLPFETDAGLSEPAPAYLVWADQPTYSEEFPWPYRIVDIAVLRSTDLKPIQPDAANEHGFSQFFLYCIKCHSINSIGGSLGPELNLPCSVTEYWNPRLLDVFIAQPDAVRQSSKMPGFQSVPESDRAAIVNYLQYMASHKSGNKGECQLGRQ